MFNNREYYEYCDHNTDELSERFAGLDLSHDEECPDCHELYENCECAIDENGQVGGQGHMAEWETGYVAVEKPSCFYPRHNPADNRYYSLWAVEGQGNKPFPC